MAEQVIFPRFSRAEKHGFHSTLKHRVDEYFKANNISRHANASMVFKTIFMLGLYFIPFAFIVSGTVESTLAIFGLALIMGVGTAGIGLSIMHDANHGAYSSKKWVNNLLGYLLNVIGGSAINWKVQHNVLHHTYTNIYEKDEDVTISSLMRFSPSAPHKKFHRFQFIYAWFFYGLMTIWWVLGKDFIKLNVYEKQGLLKKQKTTYRKEAIELIFSKVLYLAYMIGLPVLVGGIGLGLWLAAFFAMHYLAGMILGLVFQPAHVIQETDFPIPDQKGQLDSDWATHQMKTTSDFAQRSRLFSWYVGGLNYQVEHHLFPHICHIHYRNLSPIVRKTAEEFNLPYNEQKTFFAALRTHAKMLYRLGNAA